MTLPAYIHKRNQRTHHTDGAFSDAVIFRFPARSLRLSDIDQRDSQIKLKDIAHLRYVKALERGESAPLIVAFNRLEQDQPAAAVFPGLSHTTAAGETILSANSFITYTMRVLFERGWLRYQDGGWQVAAPTGDWQQRGEAVISLLSAQNRLRLESGFANTMPKELDFADFDVCKNLIPIDRCAFLSDVVAQQRPRLVFNTAFFLLEQDDFFSHHSALGEAFNLWVAERQIQRPPLYRRGAIFQHQEGHWETGFLGMDDLGITLPNGLKLTHRDAPSDGGGISFTLNKEEPSEATLYTRYYGVADQGRVLGCTPSAARRFELTVVDRRIVSWQVGGGLALPQNGFVISFAPKALSVADQRELQQILQTHFLLDYHFVRPKHQGVVQAIQNGPILLQDGRSPLTDSYLEAKEQFWTSRFLEGEAWQIGVVSTDYAANIDQTRHGRVALGVTENGDLILVMVAGVNRGLEVPGVDSDGATLLELTNLLREAGAVSAVNLDGGGSTQAYYFGGRALVPGDRRGLPQMHYERMVPSAGIVF